MSEPSIQVTTDSPEQTVAWAARWVGTLPAGTVIALHGDLGAGKTCFVKGLAEGLGIRSAVHSPTFTLINEYPGRIPLYHLDLYRIRNEDDAWELGLENYLPGDGITAIEWADRISHRLPTNTIHIKMEYGDESHTRVIKVYHCVTK